MHVRLDVADAPLGPIVPAIGTHLDATSCMIIHDWLLIEMGMIMGARKSLAGGAGALFGTISHTPDFSETKSLYSTCVDSLQIFGIEVRGFPSRTVRFCKILDIATAGCAHQKTLGIKTSCYPNAPGVYRICP